MVAPTLLELAGLDGPQADGKDDPIMQARTVSCIAAAWPHLPPLSFSREKQHMADMEQNKKQDLDICAAPAISKAVYDVQRTHAGSLTLALSGAIRRKVWSVRVPILHALASVVSRSYAPPVEAVAAVAVVDSASSTGDARGAATMTPVVSGALLAAVVQAVEICAEDAKYSQVCGCLKMFIAFRLLALQYCFIFVRCELILAAQPRDDTHVKPFTARTKERSTVCHPFIVETRFHTPAILQAFWS